MKKLLIVDDEKIERAGIIMLLEKHGYSLKVLEAANGKQALDKIRREAPDILLTDIRMPFMDGLELIQKARQLDEDLEIIIFSGYSDFEYARTAIQYGVSNYILKPVDPDEFYKTLDKVIGEADRKAQTEEIQKINQDFLGQYFLQKYINSGKPEVIEEARRLLDVEKFRDIHYMLLLETAEDFFGAYTGDLETDLKDELKLIFYCLNLSDRSMLLLMDGSVRVDYRILAEHIHAYMEKKYGVRCYVAVSSRLEGGRAMPQGYQELEALMENRFYRTEQWVFMPDTNWEGKVDFNMVEELLAKMEEDVRLRDISHLWEHFRKFGDERQKGTAFSHVYVKFAVSNIVKQMYRDMQISVEKCCKMVERLYACETMQEAIGILEENIRVYEETIFKNQNSARGDVEKVKNYIYQHYADDLSVEVLSSGVYLSPGYMSYIFKKETGEGLIRFIRIYRLERARELLRSTNKKIVQISKETGFANSSYFCKSFREYYGVSPERYRKGEPEKNGGYHSD